MPASSGTRAREGMPWTEEPHDRSVGFWQLHMRRTSARVLQRSTMSGMCILVSIPL